MRRAALLLALGLAGCATGSAGIAPLGVAQALGRAEELNGLAVEVEGVMGGCNRSGCELRGPDGASIVAGGDAAFANAARRATGRTVVVRGRFDATCLRGAAPPPPGTGMVACIGRGTPLRDSRILAVR